MSVDLIKIKQSDMKYLDIVKIVKVMWKKTEILEILIKVQGDKIGSLFFMNHKGSIKTRGWPKLRIKIFFIMVSEDYREIVLERISNSPFSISAAHSAFPNNKLIVFTILRFSHLDCLPSLSYKSGHFDCQLVFIFL